MKAIKDSLDKAVGELAGQNKEVIPRMLATIDKLAESLRPSARDAVAPIGRTCKSLTIAGNTTIDEAKAEAIRSPIADEITEEKIWHVLITEMDYESASAKIRFLDEENADERRVKAVITDPAFGVFNSPYLRAFAAQTEMQVRGKAVLRDGEIQTLFISNTGNDLL